MSGVILPQLLYPAHFSHVLNFGTGFPNKAHQHRKLGQQPNPYNLYYTHEMPLVASFDYSNCENLCCGDSKQSSLFFSLPLRVTVWRNGAEIGRACRPVVPALVSAGGKPGALVGQLPSQPPRLCSNHCSSWPAHQEMEEGPSNQER